MAGKHPGQVHFLIISSAMSLLQGGLVRCTHGCWNSRISLAVFAVSFGVCGGSVQSEPFDLTESTDLIAPLTLYDSEVGTIRDGVVLGVDPNIPDLTVFEAPREQFGHKGVVLLLGASTFDLYGTIDTSSYNSSELQQLRAVRVLRDVDRTDEPDLGGRAIVNVRSGATLRASTGSFAIITYTPTTFGPDADVGTDILVETGALVANAGDTDAMWLVGGVTASTPDKVINNGTILSANHDAIWNMAWASVDNAGLIEAPNRSAIWSSGGGLELYNRTSGIIRGLTGLALRGSVTILNEGRIEASGTYAVTAGLATDVSLVNSGSLIGDVELSGGDDIFELRPGSTINGIVNGRDGTDTLRADVSFNVNNGANPDPTKYSNFEVFEFIEFLREINGDTPEDLSVEVDREIRFTGPSSINSLTVEDAGNVVMSASVTSIGAVENGGAMSVTADAVLTAPSFVGTGALDIATGSTFTLDQSGNSEFAGQMTGDGDFVKDGAGRLQLSGNSTHSGTIIVRDGVLEVDGTVASDVIVEQTGRLDGSGTFQNITSSGVIAPGNSPGTMVSAGDVTLDASSTYEWEVDGLTYSAAGGAGSYDRIVLTDAASTFTAGGTLEPILRGISAPANNDFTPVYGDTFTIVTTANPIGISSVFDTVSQPTDGMPNNARFDVLYASNQINLVLTPDSYEQFAASFSAVSNYRNFGRALDAVRPDAGANPDTPAQDFFTQLYPLNGTQLTAAMVPLTGEIHAFAMSDLLDGARSLSRNAYVGGLQPQSEGQNAWIDVSGTRLRYSQDDVASRYESDLGNLWVGFDLEQRDDLRYGLAFGHGRSELDAGISGSADSNLTMLMGYYANRVGDIAFGAKLGIGRGEFDTKRTVVLANGPHSATASGAANIAFASVSADYHHELANGYDGKLWADVTAMYTKADSYAEGGSNSIATTVQSDTLRSGAVTVGYEVTAPLNPDNSDDESVATFGFGLRHAFGGDRIYSRSLTMHGAQWDVSGTAVDPTTALASLGVTYAVGDKQTISAAVIGQGNQDYTGVGASLSFVSRF